MVLNIAQEDHLEQAAEHLLKAHRNGRVFAFIAPMGAGKTTFIKQLCNALGVQDAMSSPTYSIVNEYRSAEDEPIYHMDLYRLESVDEALEIGIEEYLYSGHYVFIEWPQLVDDLLPEDAVQVAIKVTGPTSRQITTQEDG